MANTSDTSAATYEAFTTTAVDAFGVNLHPADVTGHFYDFKDHVKFDVTISNIIPGYVYDSFYVNISLFSASSNDSRNKRYTVSTSLVPTTNGYNTGIKIISKLDSEYIPYNFLDKEKYIIQYTVFFRKIDNHDLVVKLGHLQEFIFYSNPVTLLDDFATEDNINFGEDIFIQGLELDHSRNLDLSGNKIDTTLPEYVTFTFQRKEKPDQNNQGNYDENYIVRLDYNPSGSYLLTNNTLTAYKGYYMTIDAQWALGYSTSITSDPIFVVKIPEIKTISVLPLYIRNSAENILTIDLSGNGDLSGNLWFEFRDANDTVIATVGGNNGLIYREDNSYSFSLNDLVSAGDGLFIENVTSYNVNVKKQYDNISFDDSGVSLPEYGYSHPEPVTFALTEPTINSIAVNSLYVRDTDEKIATITVAHEAYQLYAPYAAEGIEFVFYNGNTEVARTSEYTFENASGSGSNSYPIKLSDVTPGALVHGIAYTVKAAVKVTDHEGNTSHVVSSDFSTVTFALTEPDITSIVANSVYVRNTDEKIATITVAHEAYELYAPYDASGILFVFYNDNTEVARTRAYPFVNTPSETGSTEYPIKLSEITPIINGEYLVHGIAYTVKAAVKVTDHEGNTSHVVSSDFSTVTFDLIRPVVESIIAYDIQNDGGQDGVFAPNDSGNMDIDSASQIVATVSVNTAAYKLYAPYDASGILFVFYDVNSDEVARTSAYPFVNDSYSSPKLYNIRLDDITAGTLLTNGTPYKVKAQVRLADHSGSEELRLSDNFTDVTFTQNLSPVPYVEILNTWELVTNQEPESNRTNFLASPAIGISGHFSKNAQFGSLYLKHLDTASTKFKLEYKVSSSLNVTVTDWTPVTKASLVLQGSLETLETAAARASAGTLSNVSSGEYANIPGNGLGTSQGDIVFYIPQKQVGSVNAFDETHKVEVRVTVINRSSPSLSLWGGLTSSDSTASEHLHIILKIDEYDFTNGVASEPWNSQYKAYYDSTTSLLHVNVNDSIVTANKSDVKSSSNNIIEELDEGWKIVNTGVNTNGATGGSLPKVNLYFYGNSVAAASQTSSNSFSVNQINGMGAYAVIDQHLGAKEYPFFNIYTTPTGSSDKAPMFFKSRLFHAPQSSGDTVQDSSRAGPTLLYTGTDNPLFRPEIPSNRRVKFVLLPHDNVLTIANSTYATELVNLVSLQTSSNASASQAGNFNFTLSELGLTTSSPVLSSLVMRFTTKLVLNIPVSWNSEYSHSVKVSYKYSAGALYSADQVFLKSSYPSAVSFVVDPTLGTTLYYRVRYVVTNPNLDAEATTTDGIITEKNVPNKFFPESSDYTITNALYRTFNNDEVSSITFTLTRDVDSKNRLDGVNVYFTSDDSGVGKVRIGSYTTGGSKTITLLSNSGGFLQTMESSEPTWLDYDSANISFEAFRDARVNSTNASYSSSNSALNPVASGYYVESGEQSTFGTDSDSNPIWNVPVLTSPGDDGSITLSGGVINIVNPSSDHYIQWTSDNIEPFTYDVKVTQGESTVIVDDTNTAQGKNISGNSYIIPIDLVNVDKYTVEIRKVFTSGETRERSDPVTVVFYTVKVDTSDMDITVENPSNTQYVNLSWNEPVFTGSSVTGGSGDEPSSFDNNIFAHYIKYTDSSFNLLTKLDSSEVLIERIVSPATKKQYTLPVQAIGTLYEFFMYVEANVKYTVDGVVSASNSVAFQVPLTATTPESKYIVSSIPSVGINIVPTLVQDSSNPVLNLVLNANGLEDEGFISVVIILTQDGTDSKPDGEQVFLVFPDTANSPFSFTNSVDTTTSGSGGDARLAGGDESTSAPRNINNTVLSTDPDNNTYKLTIGSVDEETGRYGLSTLAMPPTSVSGFVDNSVVNYMVILTTRRGTDIGVGEFIYKAIPLVQNVFIDMIGNQYYVNFTLTPA